jgi:hypothetical protein
MRGGGPPARGAVAARAFFLAGARRVFFLGGGGAFLFTACRTGFREGAAGFFLVPRFLPFAMELLQRAFASQSKSPRSAYSDAAGPAGVS